jgi:hypothetical protein
VRSTGLKVLLLALFLTVQLIAQDTPVGPAGTQIATQETPAAARKADALRKSAQNPVASLISVPVQNNNNFSIGPDDRIQDILNIQPVMPVRVSENWNLIARLITPIIYQPTASQPVFWGAGPAIVLPKATNRVLGQGKSPWGTRLQTAFLFPKLTKEQEKTLVEQKLKQLNQEPPTKGINPVAYRIKRGGHNETHFMSQLRPGVNKSINVIALLGGSDNLARERPNRWGTRRGVTAEVGCIEAINGGEPAETPSLSMDGNLPAHAQGRS